MAKKKNWFDRLKRFFSSETKSKQEKKEKRKRWVFGRFKSKCTPALPGPSSIYAKSLSEAEEEQSKHALAVAVATAAAAEAAVAAAQAAAEVVRLTGTPLSYHKTREVAAIIIQTAFRGYLARKALQALRGLVRLQALIRGQVVRRQTTITLKGLQSLMKIQSEARATRARMAADSLACEDKNIVHGKIKRSGDMRTTLQQNSEKKWDDSTLSKEEINALLKSRVEAALKRERAMEYAFSRQERMNWRSPTTAGKGTDILNRRWSWLDQWVGAQPLDKDVPENSPVPSPEQNLHDQLLQAPHSLVLLDAVHHGKAEETQVKYFARRSFNQSRRTVLRDDDSFTSSPSFPSYMASTASTKARFRSMSTPKQRLGVTDACSDYGTPFTSRLLSPFPSIVSEAGASKTAKSLTFHQKSPGLRGQTTPVKSHRPSNYRSFDSRCTLLNWDHYSAFR